MMKKYAQTDETGRVVAVVETSGEMDTSAGNIIEVATGSSLGMRYNSGTLAFEVIQKTEAEAALETLRAIDAETGMSRLMRESMLLLLGAGAPQKLKDKETEAAAARAKLAP